MKEEPTKNIQMGEVLSNNRQIVKLTITTRFILSRWSFQHVYFTPEEVSQFDEHIFQMGLVQLATRNGLVNIWWYDE